MESRIFDERPDRVAKLAKAVEELAEFLKAGFPGETLDNIIREVREVQERKD